jgi:hypothetical protein
LVRIKKSFKYFFFTGLYSIFIFAEEFHAFLVTDSSVGLAWDAPSGYNVSQYQVFYELQTPSGDGISSKPAYRKSVLLIYILSNYIKHLNHYTLYR